VHKTIKAVSNDLAQERYIFNTAIARCMELVNGLYKYLQDAEAASISLKDSGVLTFAIGNLLLLMAPMAPHLTEELYHQLGYVEDLQKSIHVAAWPVFDEALTIDDEVELVLQVNGKIVNKLATQRGTSKDKLEALAMADEKVQAKLNGASTKRIIVVPDKLVNVVI